jgi:S-DNA-T family DNA segregation ATPase FtsK/SpoIIIE
VDNILSREKDLALALKTPSIRIETPAMGESLVGIEVPNPIPTLVTLRSVMESPEFERLHPEAMLPLSLGKGSGGESIVTDLAKMPHLLIAGATGSGKSVCINTIVSCLIMEKTPAEVRLLLVDPKRVELTPYNGIPHLLTPVVVEVDQVVGYLKGMIQEMLDRYRRFEGAGVRNIEAYNRRMPGTMPYLIVAIDELADLMMSASFDVEQSLCRLAQLGRATGIHLIVATQRPSVDVVTGLIKANFPSRISFGVTSYVDSRTILDTVGAEKLLGRGDMLYLPLDASRPVRAQGAFISDQEIESRVEFWQTTPRAPLAPIQLRAVRDQRIEKDEGDGADELQDDLQQKAIGLAQMYSKLSTSLLQRRLRIGYPRAARLMDQLEGLGIVGPSDGSKSRDVIKKGSSPETLAVPPDLPSTV